MDAFIFRRTRHRHGGAPGGRRRTRPRTKAPPTSDNERIKYPQFNDLWVRLEASRSDISVYMYVLACVRACGWVGAIIIEFSLGLYFI